MCPDAKNQSVYLFFFPFSELIEALITWVSKDASPFQLSKNTNVHASPTAFVFIRHFHVWLMRNIILFEDHRVIRNMCQLQRSVVSQEIAQRTFQLLSIEILPKDVFLLQPFIFPGDVFFIYLERGSTWGPVQGLPVTECSAHRIKKLQLSTEFGLTDFFLLVQLCLQQSQAVPLAKVWTPDHMLQSSQKHTMTLLICLDHVLLGQQVGAVPCLLLKCSVCFRA